MTLTVTQGDAYTGVRALVITVTDEAAAPVDLTGTTLRFMVKRRKGDTDAAALISRATGSGITLASPQSGGTKGQAAIALTATETNVIAGRWYYELEATDAIGVITLAAGVFIVAPDLIQDVP